MQHLQVNSENVFYRPRMRVGNNFTDVCLSVCSGYNFSTTITKNFIFSTQIKLNHIWVKFENQGHWAKVKLAQCHILPNLYLDMFVFDWNLLK